MLTERLQILVTPEQRRRLERESGEREMSVGAIVREAIDARLGGVTREDRLRAVEEIGRMDGRFLSPEALNRLVGDEHQSSLDVLARSSQR